MRHYKRVAAVAAGAAALSLLFFASKIAQERESVTPPTPYAHRGVIDRAAHSAREGTAETLDGSRDAAISWISSHEQGYDYKGGAVKIHASSRLLGPNPDNEGDPAQVNGNLSQEVEWSVDAEDERKKGKSDRKVGSIVLCWDPRSLGPFPILPFGFITNKTFSLSHFLSVYPCNFPPTHTCHSCHSLFLII